MTEKTYPIEKLRAIVQWADWHDENYWIPSSGPVPTINEIVALYDACGKAGVDVLESLPVRYWPKRLRRMSAFYRNAA